MEQLPALDNQTKVTTEKKELNDDIRQYTESPSMLAKRQEVNKSPMEETDFRPKDMTIRRQKILDSVVDPTQYH